MLRDERIDYKKGRNDAEVFVEHINKLTPITEGNVCLVLETNFKNNSENSGCEGRIIIDGQSCIKDDFRIIKYNLLLIFLSLYLTHYL